MYYYLNDALKRREATTGRTGLYHTRGIRTGGHPHLAFHLDKLRGYSWDYKLNETIDDSEEKACPFNKAIKCE